MEIKSVLKKVSDYIWEIPKEYRSDMRVPAQVYASEEMLNELSRDRSLEQLVNVTTLPGIQRAAMVMPDAHEGYGFPIGGVAATKWPDGVISPGGIGYDINCGVRLLKSEMNFSQAENHLEKLSKEIYHEVPSGVGRGGHLKLTDKKMDELLREGAEWVIREGYGQENDKHYIESYGCLKNADADAVSSQAKKRGHDQLGTMGAGNHFVEVDRVAEIFDEDAAKALGLFKSQIVILIHTGSRGLGHQVATDYIRTMMNVMAKYNIKLPDRQLACVPFSSPEGTDYFNAMAAAANFAWSNRQMITWELRKAWGKVFGREGGRLTMVYDVAHNIAKIEEYEVDGKKQMLIVHRKGATRAFPPGNAELIDEYKSVGQPVLIPGSMGTASYVLVGTEGSMKNSFGSTCHGAGRKMSRSAAMREVKIDELTDELKKAGIHIQAGSKKGIAEEAPQAYKDVNSVVEIVHQAGIAKKVARLKPVAVIKG